MSRRYERKSTVVTTNKAFADWHEAFPNAACVVSLIDRLAHHAEVIALLCFTPRQITAVLRSH